MNRSIATALGLVVFALLPSPRLTAQQTVQIALLSGPVQPSASVPVSADASRLDAVAERNQALKAARSLHICAQTVFLTTGTLDRALMRQKDWDKLGLNIVSGQRSGDLEIQVNRVVFTHVHTYILTDKATGIVLASGKVTAFDGVLASGPMAEQIVKILSAARLGSTAANKPSGL